MVLYTQARTQAEKKRSFDRMLAFRQFRARIIEQAQYQFFGSWHYTAVREILAIHDFRDDYKALGTLVEPPISAEEAGKAIAMLKRLGMVVKDAHGIHRRVESVLSTGPDAQSVHGGPELPGSQALELARGALDPAELLGQCRQARYQGPGPGGRKRNRVYSGIRLTHPPSGPHAEASERREARRNLEDALRALHGLAHKRGRLAETAAELDCTVSALARFLKADKGLWRKAQEIRARNGLGPLK